MRAPPEVGDRITHTPLSGDGIREGVVDHIMSVQFAYVTDAGLRDMCLFDEDWTFVSSTGKAVRKGRRTRMQTYDAWVAYRREHLQGRGKIRVRFEDEDLDWSTAIYHPACPSSLVLIFNDGEEEHSLD